MTQIAQMLEEARIDKGLSRNKAAAELETSPTTYRQWMRGQRPDLARVFTLARFADESVEDVVKKMIDDEVGNGDGPSSGPIPRYINPRPNLLLVDATSSAGTMDLPEREAA